MIGSATKRILEEGTPSSLRVFRQCLGQFATGVIVLTAEHNEQLAGITVNSFSSVSLDPPLVLCSIDRKSRSFAVFETCDTFAVNILASDQIDVSQHFSSSESDKFASRVWSRGRNGAPLLQGVVAHLECRRQAAYEGGDHIILIGRVEHFVRFEAEPLLFVQGRYGVAGEHPDLAMNQQTLGPATEVTASSDALLTLLFEACRQISAIFEEHRRAEGVDVDRGRVLIGIYERPGIIAEELVSQTYLGSRIVEDALDDLIKRGYVIRQDSGCFVLSKEGRHRRESLLRRWESFQAEQLTSVSRPDADLVARVLRTFIDNSSGLT